jgi:hypothetical protein
MNVRQGVMFSSKAHASGNLQHQLQSQAVTHHVAHTFVDERKEWHSIHAGCKMLVSHEASIHRQSSKQAFNIYISPISSVTWC